MDKIKRVALAEYLNAVRSKAFIISVLALPVVMLVAVGLQMFALKKVDLTPRRFGVVDPTGRLFAALETAARERNERLGKAPPGLEKLASVLPPQPRFEPEEVRTDGRGVDEVELKLSERVRKKELFAFVIIGTNVIDADATNANVIAYHTRTPTYQELPAWIDRTIEAEVRRLRFETAGMDTRLIGRLNRGVELKHLGLAKQGRQGQVEKSKPENRLRTFAVPVAAMMLMFVVVMTSAPMLMNTVLEEKMNKVAEVLIASVSPFQLMLGKLVGCVLVSLTLSLLYLGSTVWMVGRLGQAALVPWDLLGWFLLFQVMALLIYGSMFLAIGSACNELRDAQNLMFPAMLIVMTPMMVWMPILQSPHSPFAQAMSLIPPFTPMLMMLRLAAPPGPAWWELSLAVGLTTGCLLLCVWAAAKIFRVGILAQGQSPSLWKLLRWVVSK